MLRKNKKRASGPLSDLWVPDAAPAQSGDLGSSLIAAGVISADLIANAQRVMKQTPGRGLGSILDN